MNLWKVLKDISRHQWSKFTGNSTYPIEILPKISYKDLIDLKELCGTVPCIVVRRSEQDEENTFNELGILRPEIIDTQEVPGMSMNLLGAKFKPEHTRFRVIKPGSNYWNGDQIFLFEYIQYCSELDKKANIYFEFNKISGQTFPFYRKDKDAIRLAKKLKKISSESTEVEIIGKTEVAHAPTNLNYWHVELNIYADSLDEIPESKKIKGSSTWQEAVYELALDHFLSVQARKLVDLSYEIPYDTFHNN